MADVLEEILGLRRGRVAESKKKTTLEELEREAKKKPAARPFFKALTAGPGIAVIAEMKMKSPSAGLLRKAYDPAAIAKDYEKGGARALSILTEPDRFGGDVADLNKARSAVNLPILEKDFVFDPYQIVEARVKGADAVLLIAEMLDGSQLHELVEYAREIGIEPLVELFRPESLEPVLETPARLIGINARNLRDLTMRPQNVAELSPRIPDDRAIVAESGIKTADEIRGLSEHRVSAVLIGESLLRQADLVAATRRLTEV